MKSPPRENDATTKRLRARIRNRHDDCHICGQPIDYTAHHTDPWSFQMDHLLQIANGGPNIEANVGPSHRACNRARSDKIDAIAIAAAEHLGIRINASRNGPQNMRAAIQDHAWSAGRTPCTTPDGEHCTRCRGTHNPKSGVIWVSERRWW
ncbi:hypothetical protein A5637_20700 [Mycolicibacterium fortuitum]|uniref:HNH endonuclease n=1 Tax=Mycolicibacterium fortuitum TaxID=1766 RepID=UPI0007ED2922|nr:HNH endonuclease signature motif containing protein [Mycolicibacterium fortuitum]OBK12976.1 hypothetical protein A5637_20700 [Mycolicibacterium fortuitum]